MPLPRTIAGRLFLASALSLAVAVLAVAIAAPLAARQHETAVITERLRGDAAVGAQLARSAVASGNRVAVQDLARVVARASGVRVTVVDASGSVIGESAEDPRELENHGGRPEIVAALGGGEGRAIRQSATVGRDLVYVAVPVEDDGRVIGVVRTAMSLSTLDALAAQLATAILGAAVLGAAVALALSYFLGRQLTRPLLALAQRAETAAGQEDQISHFEIRGADEVERLAAGLRRMAELSGAARRATEAERDRLAVLIEAMDDAIVIAGRDDRVRLTNPAAERLLGSTDLVGRQIVEVIRDHEILDALKRAREGIEASAQVERFQPRRFLRARVKALGGGELLLTVSDLSAIRRLETVRQDFVANVSHELRTPISSLKAMAEILEDGAIDDPPAARDFIARMHREIDGLAQLVSELLALARLESGQERLRPVPLQPRRILEDIAGRMRALANRADVSLSVESGPPIPNVIADETRVAQILSNLVHNAVKFTPPGGTIVLSASFAKTMVEVQVRDSGEGIAPPDLERIFERFYKSDTSRSTGGTGLGLAIAKHLVQAHGGEIEATSDGPGLGSTFTFTLPIA